MYFNSPLFPHYFLIGIRIFRILGFSECIVAIPLPEGSGSPISDKFSFPHFVVDYQRFSCFQFPFISPFSSHVGVAIDIWQFGFFDLFLTIFSRFLAIFELKMAVL
jgi:hypothetical protein